MICILAQRGRFLETILQDGARSGVPRRRREPQRGRSGVPPPSPGLADMSLTAPVFHSRRRRRRSPAENRHDRAPREVPFATGQVEPRGSEVAPRKRDKVKECPVGAPSTPRSGWRCGQGTKRKEQPGRKDAAPERERTRRAKKHRASGTRLSLRRSCRAV